MTGKTTTLRTKRRYAHELYPHPDEYETRPLAVDVPYLYALAIGYEVGGTGWFDMNTPEGRRLSADRTMALLRQREIALIADALLQGMTGDEAWKWAQQRSSDETGEWIGERADFYGVPYDSIKPYACGPEPEHHDHLGERNAQGWARVTRVQGKESECPDCTQQPAPELTPEEKLLTDIFGIHEADQ